jgi:adenine-specific DNA-methyltransferase
VAERLGRRWIMADLGRYERQWWQRERLHGADDEHRKVVLGFYKAEVLPQPTAHLHGRKGRALVFVDGIDSILTRDELTEAVKAAARSAGVPPAIEQSGQDARAPMVELHCLAWEFEMELRTFCHGLEAEHGVRIKLIPIPREIMEKNRTSPPPFLEVAVLEAEAVQRSAGVPPASSRRSGQDARAPAVDIKLTRFLPSLAEVPSKELEALKERAIKNGFDFIDFWAVDFDWREGKPFEHHWQDYRTRKDRSLKTVSDFGYDRYPKPGKYTACVKVVDVFGCDTSITIDVNV